MPIVSSIIIANDPQADGRFAVCERHTDDHGLTHDVNYLADPGTDVNAVMLARVPSLNKMLIDLSAAAEQQQANATARTAAIAQAQAYSTLTDDQLRSVLFMPAGSDLTQAKINIAIIAGGTI